MYLFHSIWIGSINYTYIVTVSTAIVNTFGKIFL